MCWCGESGCSWHCLHTESQKGVEGEAEELQLKLVCQPMRSNNMAKATKCIALPRYQLHSASVRHRRCNLCRYVSAPFQYFVCCLCRTPAAQRRAAGRPSAGPHPAHTAAACPAQSRTRPGRCLQQGVAQLRHTGAPAKRRPSSGAGCVRPALCQGQERRARTQHVLL